MKLFAKILLTLLFLPLFLVLLILISVRFQLLNSDFWIKTYDKNDTYQKLETAIPKIIEWQTASEGGTKQELVEAKEITSVLTKENLKVTLDKNIKNTLDYINGDSPNWTVFIPRDKIPKGLLPNFLLEKDEVSITSLASFFSRGKERLAEGGTFAIPSWIPLIGKTVWMSLFVTIAIVILFGFILFRLGALPFALITSGLITLIVGGAITLFRYVIETEWAKEGEPSQLLLGTLGVPIIAEMAKLWLIIAAFTVLVGIILAFLSKKRVK